MNHNGRREGKRRRGLWLPLISAAVLLGWAAALAGCQAKEPPLTPAAAAFKKEVKGSIDRLSKALLEPVRKGDQEAITQALKQHTPETIKMCRMCPFVVAVLGLDGAVLAVYPEKRHDKYYSDYKAVQQALKDCQICQSRFFLPDGSQLYVICAPLTLGVHQQGLIVLTAHSDEVKKRYNISEKEFFAIDFNS